MSMLFLLSLCALALAASASSAPDAVPYDTRSRRWLVDPAGVVSRNDVVYHTPSSEPWEAMPVGGGDLSAMVRFNGDLHVHLTKSDAWGFAGPPDAPLGSRFFNNVSPGHVRVVFGTRGRAAADRYFRQRLDLYSGRVRLRLGSGSTAAELEVWGHPERRVLVITVTDPAGLLGPPTVELSEWRPTMVVGAGEGRLWAREVHRRAARPHLANTGMQDYLPADRDPLLGRGTAVVVSMPGLPPGAVEVRGKTATLTPSEALPPSYTILVAAAVTRSGDPLAAAAREWDAAGRVPVRTLKEQHQAWWRKWWSQSFVRLTSPNQTADWLCAAYHVHLYTLACTNRGAVPAKWDGGAGLLQDDQRNWGLAEWVQEIRLTYLPLYAANRLEMARGLCDHYWQMLPYLREQTRQMWGIPGVWVPETVLPWGHAEDLVLRAGERNADYLHVWDPAAGPYGKFERYNPYVGFLFTAGLEVCHHFLTYCAYSGEEEFRRRRAYPFLKGVCEFISGLLRRGADGRYHLDPANALETWWMVRDPSDVLDGIRAIFPQFVRLSRLYGRDKGLRARCEEILAALPDPPRGVWREDGTVDATVDAYAPAAAKGKLPTRVNAENPALYRVFPFGLSGIGSADYQVARRTFEHRICRLEHGWSLDAVWAARLGMGEEACELLAQHAGRYNRFRYGGWTSNDSRVFPGGLSAAPFLDAGGLSAFALNEILVQSHGGVVRVLPAVSPSWSGTFRLLAQGGFLVGAHFEGGCARFVEVVSLKGGPCLLANPWGSHCTVREGNRVLFQSAGAILRIATRKGRTYLVEPSDQPLSAVRSVGIVDRPNESPGLPGRDCVAAAAE